MRTAATVLAISGWAVVPQWELRYSIFDSSTQTSKSFLDGSFVQCWSQADITNYMYGTVTSYDEATGALVVDVTVVGGAGTLADWLIVTAIMDALLYALVLPVLDQRWRWSSPGKRLRVQTVESLTPLRASSSRGGMSALPAVAHRGHRPGRPQP